MMKFLSAKNTKISPKCFPKPSKTLQNGWSFGGEIDFPLQQSSQRASKTTFELNMTQMVQKSSQKASKIHPKWCHNDPHDVIIMLVSL